MTKHRTRV